MLPKINTLKQYYLHKQELVYIRSWAVMWRTPLPNSSPYFGYFEVSADRHISSPWIWWHFCLCKGPRVRLEINILLSMKLTATESLLYRWTTRQSLFLFRCITELRRCNTHNSRNRSSKLFAHTVTYQIYLQNNWKKHGTCCTVNGHQSTESLFSPSKA